MTKYLTQKDKILVIIGPSAVGKSSLVNNLIAKNIVGLTPTYTDRPKRQNEQDNEHVFVSSAEFNKLVERGFFIHRPLRFFGLNYRYASPKLTALDSEKVPVIMARISAMPLVNKLFPNNVVYQIEADKSIVEARLKARQESGIELGSRLIDYDSEILLGRNVANRIFTNDTTLKTITGTVTAAIKNDFGL